MAWEQKDVVTSVASNAAKQPEDDEPDQPGRRRGDPAAGVQRVGAAGVAAGRRRRLGVAAGARLDHESR